VAEHPRQRGVPTADQPRGERLDHRLVGRSQSLVASPVKHREATRCDVGRDGRSQPRLANAGFADDEHDRCAASGNGRQHRPGLRQFGAPPDQRRARRHGQRGRQRRVTGAVQDELIDLQRSLEAPQDPLAHEPERMRGAAPAQAHRCVGHQHRPACRLGTQAAGLNGRGRLL
jgi:hypothetical protein